MRRRRGGREWLLQQAVRLEEIQNMGVGAVLLFMDSKGRRNQKKCLESLNTEEEWGEGAYGPVRSLLGVS